MSELTDFIVKYRIKNLKAMLDLYTPECQSELVKLIMEKEDTSLLTFESELLSIICHIHDLTKRELFARTRLRYVIEARHIGYLFLYAGTKMTLSQIGKTIGNNDHSTVLHGVKKVIDMYKFDSLYRNYVDETILLLEERSYNCELFKTRLNEHRRIKTSLRITDFKSSIIRKPVEFVELKDTKNDIPTSDSGTSGGIFFGESSICVF